MTPSEIQPGMKFGHWTVKKYSHTNKHRIKYFLCECDCGTQRAVRGVSLIQGTSTACCKQCNNNIIGQTFGKLTVLRADKSKPGYYWCHCECGREKSIYGSHLRAGMTKSCGCLRGKYDSYKKISPETLKRYEDAIGKKFGSLTVINSANEGYFNCVCDCGKTCQVGKYHLISGNTTSCGCKRAKTLIAKRDKECQSYIGKTFNHLLVKSYEYKNNNFWLNCVCDCGKEVTYLATKVTTGYVQSCGHLKSKAEEKMEQILNKLQVPYQREYKFQDCADKRPLPFDFAIFNGAGEVIGLIELNGAQHYIQGGWATKEHVAYVQKHDKMKFNFCKQCGIPLLVIPYQYYDELEKFLTTSNFWKILTENFND